LESGLNNGVLREKFDKALRDLKGNKHKTKAELWKESGEKMWSKLFKLIKKIFKSGELPLDFLECKNITIPKKATANKCDQCRTISLLTYVSKI